MDRQKSWELNSGYIEVFTTWLEVSTTVFQEFPTDFFFHTSPERSLFFKYSPKEVVAWTAQSCFSSSSMGFSMAGVFWFSVKKPATEVD